MFCPEAQELYQGYLDKTLRKVSYTSNEHV